MNQEKKSVFGIEPLTPRALEMLEQHEKFWEYLDGPELYKILQDYRFAGNDIGTRIITLRNTLMRKAEEIYGKETTAGKELDPRTTPPGAEAQ